MIYLDLEMNQIKNGRGEVISIGAIKVINGNIIDAFHESVKPSSNRELDPYITVLTGITTEDIDDAEYFYVVFEKFMLWAENEISFCYGAADKNSLVFSLRRESQRFKYSYKTRMRIDKYIKNNIIDLGPYIWGIDNDNYYMPLSEIADRKVNLDIDLRKVHNPVYDSFLLFKIHEFYKKGNIENTLISKNKGGVYDK